MTRDVRTQPHMTADHLIRLYPRAWRERYGEEFLSTIGDGALHLQQVIDIVAGAIDAWLSPTMRRQLRAAQTDAHQGAPMTKTLTALCHGKSVRYTKRDGMIGAAVMLASILLLVFAASLLKSRGHAAAAEVVLANSLMFGIVLSMPFWMLKGQPWRAQVVLVSTLLLILTAIAWIASLL
jgi:hypothetical protein